MQVRIGMGVGKGVGMGGGVGMRMGGGIRGSVRGGWGGGDLLTPSMTYQQTNPLRPAPHYM